MKLELEQIHSLKKLESGLFEMDYFEIAGDESMETRVGTLLELCNFIASTLQTWVNKVALVEKVLLKFNLNWMDLSPYTIRQKIFLNSDITNGYTVNRQIIGIDIEIDPNKYRFNGFKNIFVYKVKTGSEITIVEFDNINSVYEIYLHSKNLLDTAIRLCKENNYDLSNDN